MEQTVLNFIQTKSYGKLFHDDNIIAGTEGAANQFMVGYYSEYAHKYCTMAVDVARREAEKSDCLRNYYYYYLGLKDY